MRRAAILCAISLLLCPVPISLAQSLDESQEAKRLRVCERSISDFSKEITELRHRVTECEGPSSEARQDYDKAYWKQKAQMLEVERSAFLWQHTAGNVVLGLVVLITLSGILLAAYQLYLSFKIGQKIDAQTLDISAQKAQVTSSVIGVTVLIIAGAFLMIFLKEIYGINYVAPAPTTPQQTPATP